VLRGSFLFSVSNASYHKAVFLKQHRDHRAAFARHTLDRNHGSKIFVKLEFSSSANQ